MIRRIMLMDDEARNLFIGVEAGYVFHESWIVNRVPGTGLGVRELRLIFVVISVNAGISVFRCSIKNLKRKLSARQRTDGAHLERKLTPLIVYATSRIRQHNEAHDHEKYSTVHPSGPSCEDKDDSGQYETDDPQNERCFLQNNLLGSSFKGGFDHIWGAQRNQRRLDVLSPERQFTNC